MPNVSIHPRRTLVRRSGGMPCWIQFSLAVPGFAFPNRSRAVVVILSQWGRSIMRAVAHIIFPDPTSAFTVAPLVARKVERLVRRFHFLVHRFTPQIASRGIAMHAIAWSSDSQNQRPESVHALNSSHFIPVGGSRGPPRK